MSKTTICRITVGDYIFRGCISARVRSTRTSLGDTCELELHSRGVVKDKQRTPVDLGKYFAEGMEVKVELGYYPRLVKRFEGYIKTISPNESIKIACEDEVYQLKRTAPVTKTYRNISLKSLLKAFKPDITLADSIPNTIIEEYIVNNATAAEALQDLRDTYHLDIYFRDKKLWAGMPYTEPNLGVVKYMIRKDATNICNIQKDNLEYLTKETSKIRVRVISMLKNNKKIQVEVGDKNGELRTEYYYGIEDKDVMRTLGEGLLTKYKVEGYKGSITTWGVPIINHSMGAMLIDPRYNGRKSTSVVDTVEDLFNDNGWELNLTIGQKIG